MFSTTRFLNLSSIAFHFELSPLSVAKRYGLAHLGRILAHSSLKRFEPAELGGEDVGISLLIFLAYLCSLLNL